MKYTKQRGPNTVTTKLYLWNPIGDLIALYTGHKNIDKKWNLPYGLKTIFRTN